MPPLLLLGYNRPARMNELISSLSVVSPPLILVAVDGPKKSNPEDALATKLTQESVNLINWKCDIRTRFRDTNLGLKNAVTDAINWAISEHGSVIVMEDDLVPGPQAVPYAEQMLKIHRDNLSIAHINLYNIVPVSHLENQTNHSRLTRFPESYGWATWERAWNQYDDSLSWALNCTTRELAKVTGSALSALKWKINFHDAAAGRIQTWAYRWLATIWSKNQKIVSPNANLSRYRGFNSGTHTFRKSRFDELPIGNIELKHLDSTTTFEAAADDFMANRVFGENILGVVDGLASSMIMELRDKINQVRNGSKGRP